MTFDLRVLEFEEVRSLLAGKCVCGLGRHRVAEMAPMADAATLADAVAVTREMMDLMAASNAPPIGDLRDVSESLARVAPARATLDPEELLHLKDFLETAGRLRAFFAAHADEIPNLHQLSQPLHHAPALVRSIDEKIAPNAIVRDTASNDLRTIRADIFSTEGRIQKDLQKMVRQFTDSGVLQDDFFTLRNNRYVLPVKSDARGRIKGIIHDSSNSGETVFIEPFETLEQTNHLAELRMREREEVYRILLQVASHVRDELNVLHYNTEILADLDFIYAKARFGEAHRCAFPSLTGRDRPLSLVDAHHPLLFALAPEQSQPLNLALNCDDRVLIVTGPNAGGKTTALKTVGLIILMVQSAVPVPASPRSHMPVFSHVLADIGDEQSILTGVSTFSAHMRRMASILDQAEAQSLVLLDELGTATDPGEGTALAVAMLESLALRGSITLATTHLGSMKTWAHTFAGARNASFRLSDRDHRPTFRLTLDMPGISEALIIAEQVGLPESIIRRARELIMPGDGDATGLLLSLQAKETELAARIDDVEAQQADLHERHSEMIRLEAQLRDEKRTMRKSLLASHETMLREERAKIESMIAHLPSKRALQEAKAAVEEGMQTVARDRADLTLETDNAASGEVTIGARVRLKQVNDEGEVMEINIRRGTARVALRNSVMEVRLSDLILLASARRPGTQRKPDEPSRIAVSYRRPENVNVSLDLHGRRVDEALEMVDKHIDNALAGGLGWVRLIHGQGSGALRRAIHEHLRVNPIVKDLRPGAPNEGAGAVTIVEFR